MIERIEWTRVLLDGRLVGGICTSADLAPVTSEERLALRAAYDAGYRLVSGGHWFRDAAGRLAFDCGNTLNCGDATCGGWH